MSNHIKQLTCLDQGRNLRDLVGECADINLSSFPCSARSGGEHQHHNLAHCAGGGLGSLRTN